MSLLLREVKRSSTASPERPKDPEGLILEAWGQGLMVGSLVIMMAVAAANMIKGKILHKLIIVELVLAIGHGTFIFLHEPAYGWYLSATAIGLNVSWTLHNVIAWLKIKPFLPRWGSQLYLGTLLLVQPYWVLEIYANFAFYNKGSLLFLVTRPLEPLFRDPWWFCTTCALYYNIKRHYTLSLLELVRISPRFGIMLLSMILSLLFVIVDTCAIMGVFQTTLPVGIEPFWKISFILKCLCDTVILDDFKQALDRIREHWIQVHLQSDEINLRGQRCNGTDGDPPALENNLPERAPEVHVTYSFDVSESCTECVHPHAQV